jgi:hypothetical protein
LRQQGWGQLIENSLAGSDLRACRLLTRVMLHVRVMHAHQLILSLLVAGLSSILVMFSLPYIGTQSRILFPTKGPDMPDMPTVNILTMTFFA